VLPNPLKAVDPPEVLLNNPPEVPVGGAGWVVEMPVAFVDVLFAAVLPPKILPVFPAVV
jgi:hypothetical protein